MSIILNIASTGQGKYDKQIHSFFSEPQILKKLVTRTEKCKQCDTVQWLVYMSMKFHVPVKSIYTIV